MTSSNYQNESETSTQINSDQTQSLITNELSENKSNQTESTQLNTLTNNNVPSSNENSIFVAQSETNVNNFNSNNFILFDGTIDDASDEISDDASDEIS